MKENLFEHLAEVHAWMPSACLTTIAPLTPNDRAAYFFAAAKLCEGRGLVVDAGALLGGTAICLAEGLKANKLIDDSVFRGPRPIVSVDLFEVLEENWGDLYPQMAGLKLGDSFQHLFDFNTRSYSDLIKSQKVDLSKEGFFFDQPIELLCLDVLKSSVLTERCFEAFFPNLIPGVSIVLHQDHVHATLPFAISAFDLFQDELELIGECVHTAAFRCREPLSIEGVREKFAANPDWATGPGMLAAIERSIERCENAKARLIYRIARALCLRRYFDARSSEQAFIAALLDERQVLATLSHEELQDLQYYFRRFVRWMK